MSRKTVFVVCALITLFQAKLEALVIRTYSSSEHDRFLNFPDNPGHNPDFIHANLDLTGVGWYEAGAPIQQRGLTMVSPIHFLGANHAQPGIGKVVRFLSTDGQLKSFTVATQTAITNFNGDPYDVLLGTLSNRIEPGDNIAYHPYLNYNNNLSYYGAPLVMLGRNGQGARQTVFSIGYLTAPSINQTRAILSKYFSSGGSDDAYFNNGDSGSPSFIAYNGMAAIVGIHSVVATSSYPYTNYDCFIPHYIDELNAIMETDGYRMTKAIPGSTTLTATRTTTSPVIRAGHPFTIDFTINNTGNTLAENIKLTNTFPAGTIVANSNGTDWFDETTAATIKARKASLVKNSPSNYSITLSIPAAGTASHQMGYACDQFSAATENFNITVIESFVSWAANLDDFTSEGDDDNDGIGNLLEYAFGGEPDVASQYHPNTTEPLVPQYANSKISYIRRTDASTRALSYQLKTSTTLEGGTWSDAAPMVSQTSVAPMAGDFERVTHTLTASDTERFFRVEVTLSE
ncbi:MAG: hypothetical protein H7A51_17910 [Akkermansiaceae bacterium]|nr:hypothetical protein [Akkermansiaceae bacterium]